MKKLITVLLIVLIVAGWGSALLNSESEGEKEYNSYIETAQDYTERGLYEKAIAQYESAMEIKATEELWEEIFAVYELWNEEDSDAYEGYVGAAVSAYAQYPSNADFLILLCELYIAEGEYSEACDVIEDAVSDLRKNEEVSAIYIEAKYAYELDWNGYSAFRALSDGLYAVSISGAWEYIEEDGTDEGEYEDLVFAGSVSDGGIRLVQDSEKTYLVDSDGVVQGIFDFEPDDAGIYSDDDGLIAVLNGESWGYYDILGDYQFGDYEEAGTFSDGQAAVKQDGVWFIIDTEGNRVSDDTYDDIVLQADGTHIKDGYMAASQDGEYKIYSDGEEIAGGYEDVDIITDDGLVAVCKDGKWGFINLEGEEVIAFEYEDAKSFSNGLAAVSDGSKWGFINTDGVLVIDYTFYGADYFNSEGACMVDTAQVDDVWQLAVLYVGLD